MSQKQNTIRLVFSRRSSVARVALAASLSFVLLGTFGCQGTKCALCGDGGKNQNDKILDRGQENVPKPIASPLEPNGASTNPDSIEARPTDGSGNVSASNDWVSGKVEARNAANVDWETRSAPTSESGSASSSDSATAADLATAVSSNAETVANAETVKNAESVKNDEVVDDSESVKSVETVKNDAAESNAENVESSAGEERLQEESPTLPFKTDEYAGTDAFERSDVAETSARQAALRLGAASDFSDVKAQTIPAVQNTEVELNSNAEKNDSGADSNAEKNDAESKKQEESAPNDDDSFVVAPNVATFRTASARRAVSTTIGDVRAIPRTVSLKTTLAPSPEAPVFAPNVDPSTFGGRAIDASASGRCRPIDSAATFVPASNARKTVSARTFGYEYATVRTEENPENGR